MIALSVTKKQNLWHIESGCSKNMKRDTNKFISQRKDNKGKATIGDNMSSRIISKGTTAINNKIKDENVLQVQDLKPNIISVSQTCD